MMKGQKPTRGGQKPKRKGLPPKQRAQVRELAEQSGIPTHLAAQVVTGKRTLKEVLSELQARDRVKRMAAEGTLSSAYAPQVLAGRWTLDEALFLSRLRQRKTAPDYTRCHLDDFAREDRAVGIAAVGRQLLVGRVAEARTFDLVLADREGTETTLLKHDIKFYFDAGRKKHLIKSIQWGDEGPGMDPDHLRRIRHRVDIKARHLLAAQEADKTVSWETAEADLLRGKLIWFGRYEALLQTSRGDTVVLMRHAVRSLT
jgi:hypothetical protein